MSPQLLGLSNLFPLPTITISIPASTATHVSEPSPEQSATTAIPTVSSQTSPNQSTMLSTSSTIPLTASASSSTLISSAFLPTASSTNVIIHNHSKSRILPIAGTISALLIGVVLIVLYVHCTRRRKKLREMLVTQGDCQDPNSSTRGRRNYGSDLCEAVEPFDTSQRWLTPEISSRYLNAINKNQGSEKLPENTYPSPAARQREKRIPEFTRGANSDQIQPSNIGEILMEQNGGLIQRPSRMGDIDPDLNASQRRSLLVEALQERLRIVELENIALRSVHHPQREESSNLERELQELIPPPDYTTTLNTS